MARAHYEQEDRIVNQELDDLYTGNRTYSAKEDYEQDRRPGKNYVVLRSYGFGGKASYHLMRATSHGTAALYCMKPHDSTEIRFMVWEADKDGLPKVGYAPQLFIISFSITEVTQ